MSYKIFSIVIAASLILAFTGCTEVTPPIEDEEKTVDSYTIDEISKHNTQEDCWLLIENGVYNINGFTVSHPGGEAIFEGCGTDSTVLFGSRPMGSGTPHSPNANEMLKDYYIGEFIK